MEFREMIIDGFNRLPQEMASILKGLSAEDLDIQPHPNCNSTGWTAWHLTRVQDGQISDLMGEEQLWTKEEWYKKFKRNPDPNDSGYGHTPEQVRAFRSPTAKVQLEYLKATVERTNSYLASLKPSDLDRVLDEPWFKPLPTVGVRIVSILADCHQHAGEASYIRGLLKAMKKI